MPEGDFHGRLPTKILSAANTYVEPTPIPTELAASAATAYLVSTSAAISPPPSPPPKLESMRWRDIREDLPDPGTLAVETIESRVADDLAYRAYQASFLSGARHRQTAGGGAKSLEEIATVKVVESLRYDVESGLQTLQKSPQILQEMVLDRMHYVSFRGLQEFVKGSSEEDGKEEDLVAKEAKMDLEVWVIKNELIMRQDPASISGLVTLDDNLDIVFPGSTVNGTYREIRRRQPPKSNFCFFDERKPAVIRIHNTTMGYIKTFHESTSGVLDGLDWSNVVVAGGIALNTLLRVDDQEPEGEQADTWVSADRDSDIDVYIYGIKNPREANKKIKHIYEIWAKNVDAAALAAGAEVPKKLIIKNSKTVNFLSEYPHRRIQIILKIVASPAEVLLNFDLDPCAIGFNGTEVLMLPRCARALETGYSVFTTDLVEGHHLGDRRETQLPRVYKYADRGFGIRILPQYLRTLKQHDFRFYHPKRHPWESPVESEFVEPAEPTTPRDEAEKHKIMKGLKLTKLVAYTMDDFVHRLWIGKTKRSKYKSPYDSGSDEEDSDHEGEKILVDLGHFDGRRQYAGSTPHGKKGLGGFELFFWHVALWQKELEGLLVIQRDSFISPSYEPDGYADLPKYEWNSTFGTEKYAKEISDYNSHLYQMIRNWITFETDIRYGDDPAFEGYFCRRSERLFCGDNIDEMMERELAIPVFIPQKFEDYANRVVKEVLKEKGIIEPTEEDFEFLTPVHKEGDGRGVIPRIERGDNNWAFWLIGPSLSWARIDRRIDEIFEVLWNLFNIGVATRHSELFAPTGQQALSELLKLHLDRRSPRVAPTPAADKPTEKQVFTWPDQREIQLFKKWMVDKPNDVDRNMPGYQCDMGHRRFKEEDYDPRIGEEDEADFWDVEDEKIDLGEWLAWGGPLQDEKVEYLEVRGEKRKRVSLAGSLAPPTKRVEAEGDSGGESGDGGGNEGDGDHVEDGGNDEK